MLRIREPQHGASVADDRHKRFNNDERRPLDGRPSLRSVGCSSAELRRPVVEPAGLEPATCRLRSSVQTVESSAATA